MSLKLAIIAATLLTAASAQAQALEIPRRATVYSSEGTKIGRVDQVVTGEDGSAQAVKIIYRGKFITIPTNTISTTDKGLTTSLTDDLIRKL